MKVHVSPSVVPFYWFSLFPDFEDALINSLAKNHNMDAIITNNIADFIRLNLPVYRPVVFISLYRGVYPG